MRDDTKEIEETVDDLRRLFSDLTRLATRARVRKVMTPGAHDLSPTDTWLLSHLVEGGPARMSTLAEWQDVDRSTMTTQVRRLERAGFVTRRPDPTDRRASLVTVTVLGETTYREIRRRASAFFANVLSGWTPQQRHELIESMARLSSALEEHMD